MKFLILFALFLVATPVLAVPPADPFFDSAAGSSNIETPTAEAESMLSLTDANLAFSGDSAKAAFEFLKRNGATEQTPTAGGETFVQGKQIVCGRLQKNFECRLTLTKAGEIKESAIPNVPVLGR